MTQNEPTRGIWHWQLVRLILGLTIIILGTILITKGFTEIAIRENIRWTAQISFTCFCIAFGASSFHLLIRNSFSFWILMNRRHWGISFAIVHLIHLLFLIILQLYFYPVFNSAGIDAILAGGGAYVFLILMLLTSFDKFAKMISKTQWKWLHKIGSYWIWAIFLSTTLIVSFTKIEYLLYVFILIFVLGLRIWSYWKFKNDSL